MKLMTADTFNTPRTVGAAEAVEYVVDKTTSHYDGYQEQQNARVEALQHMLGRLLEKLIANGALRPEQVSEIFDYDVIAEAD